MVAPAALRIRLFGGLDVEGVPPAELGSRKARTVLKVLALGRGGAVAPGKLVDALWHDDATPTRPVEQVGVLVSRLRRTLGADRLVRTEAGWVLHVDWLDLVEAEALAAEAATRLDLGQPASARTAAQAALELVRGPLLPDDDGAWVEVDRAACERLRGRLRLITAEAALLAGELGTAALDAERALDADPFDEAALRIAMRAHAGAGRSGTALALYARVRHHLADELGVGPGPETEAVHTVVLLAEGAPPTTTGPAPIVGRAEELARLDDAARTVSGGPVLTVEVVGEAGIGKTALLDAWAGTTTLTVLRARCDELGRALPLQPVLDALGADDLVVGGGEAHRTTSVIDAAAGQTALFAELLRRLEARLAPAGVALVLDDVQWADPLTLAFIRYVRRRGRRCLVAVARRAAAGAAAADLGADERVALGPLSHDAVAALVGAGRAAALHERSGGNPLLLLHLAASPDDDLPDSVRDAVVALVGGLGAEVAATVGAAAVLGTEVDLDLLAAVLRRPAVDVLADLDAASANGLLTDRVGLAFAHSLVRDALVAGTSPTRTAWLHRQAAAELTLRPAPDRLAVARHARAGGDRVLASTSLMRAAADSVARFDLESAERLLDDAIELDDVPTARLARARVRLARSSFDGAGADARRAMDRGAGAEAYEVAGWVAYYERDHERAVRCADEGAARAVDDAVRASCLALGGRVRHARGDLGEAASTLEEALRVAPAGMRSLAQVWLSGVRSHQSRPADALELAERALLRPDQVGHPFAPLHGRFALVTSLGHAGRIGEAFTAVDATLALIAGAGEVAQRFRPVFLNVRGWLLRNVGLLAEADAANLEALDAIGPAAMWSGEPHHVAHLDLLDGALARVDDVDVVRWLAEAALVDGWDGTMAWRQRLRLDLLRARIDLRRGADHEAVARARSVRDRAAATGVPRYRLLAELLLDEAAAGEGEADRVGVSARLAALAEVAAPEAWWRAAELAVALDDGALAARADRSAAALVADVARVGLDVGDAVATRLAAIRARTPTRR